MTSSSPHENPTPRQRSEHPGFAVWFTGLPASGKTTIARELHGRLRACGADGELLDSDQLREILTPQPQYDERERDLFYRATACIAKYLTEHGDNVLIAATANRRRYRDLARTFIERFMEVHVDCPAATCEARDPKGLYRQARQGGAPQLPGVRADYEPPLAPDLVIRSDTQSPQNAADKVLRELQSRGWISSDKDRR